MTFESSARELKGWPSALLDSLRIVAALVVFYIHAFDKWYPMNAHPVGEPGEPSHAAVVVFFVLSGYVIAHTTIRNNRGGRQYALARLSRLCSIVVPALLITALIQLVISIRSPEMMADYNRGYSWVRYLASGLFVNEVWFFSSAPPINVSLWSLSFEFWYYVIFGFWFFGKRSWKSYLLLMFAVVIAGPKILAMMPIWLAGYMGYVLPRPQLKASLAWPLVFAVILVGLLTVIYLPFMPYQVGYRPLYYANQFVTDWLVGLFIALSLWVLPAGDNTGFEIKLSNQLRKAADLTFPLYVLHFPLLILWRSIFGYHQYNAAEFWKAMISVLAVACVLGILLEMQKPFWSKLFKQLLKLNHKRPIISP